MVQERNRPFTARSVLASALLGMDPPELPVAQLVRLTGLFGISANRARVALSRMVAAGEATTDGSGTYRLAGRLRERQARQSASRAGSTVPFTGQWWVAVVVTSGSSAEIRTARRRSLAYARLAELREGVWMRPDNLEVRLPEDLRTDVELMTAEPSDPDRLARAPVGPAGVGGPGRPTARRDGGVDARPCRGVGTGVRALRRRVAPPAGRSPPARGVAPGGWPGRAPAGRLRPLGRPLPDHVARLEPGLTQAAWDCEIHVAYMSA